MKTNELRNHFAACAPEVPQWWLDQHLCKDTKLDPKKVIGSPPTDACALALSDWLKDGAGVDLKQMLPFHEEGACERLDVVWCTAAQERLEAAQRANEEAKHRHAIEVNARWRWHWARLMVIAKRTKTIDDRVRWSPQLENALIDIEDFLINLGSLNAQFSSPDPRGSVEVPDDHEVLRELRIRILGSGPRAMESIHYIRHNTPNVPPA